MSEFNLNALSIVDLKELANDVSAELAKRREALKLERDSKKVEKAKNKEENAKARIAKAEAKAKATAEKIAVREAKLAKAKEVAAARLAKIAEKLEETKKKNTNVTGVTLKKMGAAVGKVVANRK